MKKILILVIAAIMNYGPPALAVPQYINYQGYLTRTNGSPLDTAVAMTFTIYDASIGGSAVWTETRASVLVSDGLFNASLGSVTPLPDVFSANRYLGIRIGTDTEMIPRQPITSVANAYRVGTVDGASGGTITGNVNIIGKGTIGPGHTNSGLYAFVAGAANDASGDYSTVSGGRYNSALGDYGSVGGGWYNQANGGWATVGGGEMNIATGYVATIPGGSSNSASGAYSFAAGYAATVSGEKSFALGSNINCTADSAFVWSDGSGTVTGIGLSRSFNVKASRGTRIWTSSDISSGVTIGAGGNAWVQVSDSTKKQRIRPLDTQDILTRFSSLPLKRWEYKSEEQGTEHVGPMAQDFWNSFHLGNEPLGISTIDADGVMMAAIQELAKENAELKARLAQLETQWQTHIAGQQKALKEDK